MVFKLWMAMAGVLALIWFARIFAAGYASRHRRILTESSFNGPPNPAPKISVVVAAKDEEANIEACTQSLLAQDYPCYNIIAVNDRSTDRTLEILRRLEGQAGGKLRVVDVRSLRDGWFGKNNAMREGIELADGEWILMTDADCRHTSPKTLTIGMREAMAHKADFLSIFPVLETPTVWETIIQPVAALILIIWFLPKRVNDPRTATAYANGMFMLVRRSCYDAIGGHAAVRTEVNEDIKLARNIKRHGFHLRVAENRGLLVSRMYRTPREAWRGWSRIYYGSLDTVRRLGLTMVMIGFNSVFPFASLVAALLGWAVSSPENAPQWQAAVFAWLGVVCLLQVSMFRFYRLMRIGPAWSLTYILGALTAFGMLGSACLKALGLSATTWRGTTYLGKQTVDAGTPAS